MVMLNHFCGMIVVEEMVVRLVNEKVISSVM